MKKRISRRFGKVPSVDAEQTVREQVTVGFTQTSARVTGYPLAVFKDGDQVDIRDARIADTAYLVYGRESWHGSQLANHPGNRILLLYECNRSRIIYDPHISHAINRSIHSKRNAEA